MKRCKKKDPKVTKISYMLIIIYGTVRHFEKFCKLVVKPMLC